MANLSHLPQAWRESGLSQRAFCEREGINLATFSYWRAKELREQQRGDRPAAFTEVIVEPRRGEPDEARAIEITYPDGTRVRIPVPATVRSAQC